ncbi:8071_t:CDS:2, partial [Gigaspora rosea]
KFLALCLGLNGTNAKNFCLYCICNKKEIGLYNKNWKKKSINILANDYTLYPEHIWQPLFTMILLENWIPDELHLLLRITDHLWALMLAEVQINNKKIRKIICDEIKQIVLQNFNFIKLFNQQRAILIKMLWDEFYNLYTSLLDITTTGDEFEYYAKEWIELFFTPSIGTTNTSMFVKGLYKPSDIIPYMHLLYSHIPNLIQHYNEIGLHAFFCEPIEKKS